LLLKIGHRRVSFASSASSDTRSQPRRSTTVSLQDIT
jgi:hypothetical protein